MRLCNEAIALSIIILIGDVYLFGVGISTLAHLLIGLTFVIATNSVCKNPNFKWLVLFSHLILSVGIILLIVEYRDMTN